MPRKFILREYALPPAFTQYQFSHAINPMTRTWQFGHLKDAQLFNTIKNIPRWQQCQDLSPWLSSLDVMIFYLLDEESLVMPSPTRLLTNEPIALVFRSLGYSDRLICQGLWFTNRWKRLTILLAIFVKRRPYTRSALRPAAVQL